MKYVFFIFCLSFFQIKAQNSFIGSYTGYFNGDNVTLVLESAGANLLKGSMQDEHNSYRVNATYLNNKLTGKATELSFGLELNMTAILDGNNLNSIFEYDLFGVKEKMEVKFIKSKPSNKTQISPESITDSKSTNRDHQVVGVWVKEQNYSSGYGSNGTYGSMNVKESMIFNQDGSMSEGGGSTVISGNNYSGSNSSSNSKLILGIKWRTENSRIYLKITENGKTQEVELGKYYIESGRMLITGTTGEKLLLTKQ